MSRFKDRMCAFGSCREEFEYRWCGLGAKKYCDFHSKMMPSLRNATYYKKDKKKYKERSKKWNDAHPRSTWTKKQLDSQREACRKYREKNAKRIAEYQAKYFQENKERSYEKKKIWLQKNRDSVLKSRARYNKRRRELYAERRKAGVL